MKRSKHKKKRVSYGQKKNLKKEAKGKQAPRTSSPRLGGETARFCLGLVPSFLYLIKGSKTPPQCNEKWPRNGNCSRLRPDIRTARILSG